jgi:hypothetical protein
MRIPINAGNGSLRGSILVEGDKQQLFDRNGRLLGYSQFGKAYTPNGSLVGDASLLTTLLPN